MVEFSIKNTGIGLTKKGIDALFQKFGNINRFHDGLDFDIERSALGLCISEEIIELHNGEILVESAGRNEGSTFTIKLPKSNK